MTTIHTSPSDIVSPRPGEVSDAIRRAAGGKPARAAKTCGQSLAEFALTVPMVLLMVLFGLDFGRVFLGWVALHQAAREAANYAAMNPTAWTLPYNLIVQAEYEKIIETEASNINCTLESPISAPTFGDGTGIGAPATVELSCQFDLITPLIGILTGDPIPVSASSAFPIRSGTIEDIPVESIVPTASPAPSTSAAPSVNPAPTPTADPSAPATSPLPTAVPTPTPAPTPANCTVISLLNVQSNKAQADWRAAGFSGSVVFSPLVPPNYRIAWQSLTVGISVACSSSILARSSVP